jgi:methylated-DNA-[protein]-cysteine S-methyltransferase
MNQVANLESGKTGRYVMRAFACEIDSPVGPLFVAVDESGALVRLEFLGSREARSLAADLETSGARVEWDASRCEIVTRQLDEYFRGERREFELEVRPAGTPFQLRVWDELRRIPFGTTISYAELAARIGEPGASRAVGGANGTNPIAIVVPCHRVIGADGSLTGYGGGLPIKRALLALEKSGAQIEMPMA